jgi:FKBP-type peptidyl-prolyl cis-trans isomerase
MKNMWVWVGVPAGIGVMLLLLVVMGSDTAGGEVIQYMTMETQEGVTKIGFVDKKVGTGLKAKKGDEVSVYISGRVKNGPVIRQKKKETIELGNPQQPTDPAVEKALIGMQEGGVREIIIPSGPRGNQKMGIPPNSELRIEIELVKVID